MVAFPFVVAMRGLSGRAGFGLAGTDQPAAAAARHGMPEYVCGRHAGREQYRACSAIIVKYPSARAVFVSVLARFERCRECMQCFH
jgi:hypothetical protein